MLPATYAPPPQWAAFVGHTPAAHDPRAASLPWLDGTHGTYAHAPPGVADAAQTRIPAPPSTHPAPYAPPPEQSPSWVQAPAAQGSAPGPTWLGAPHLHAPPGVADHAQSHIIASEQSPLLSIVQLHAMVFPERTALREAALRELAQGPPAALTPPPPRVPCVMGPVPSIIAADAPPYAVFFPTMVPPATPLPHPAAFPSTGGQQPTVLFRQPQCMDYASDDGGSRDDDGSDDDGSDDEGDDHGGIYGTTGYEPTPAPPPHPYASQQACGSAAPVFSPPLLHVHGYGNGLSAGFSGDLGGGYRGNCGATGYEPMPAPPPHATPHQPWGAAQFPATPPFHPPPHAAGYAGV